MATRIKASASTSAVRRRIKRRSERASHKKNKNKNTTLRSRKQRARKTARVMRGGGGTPYYYSMYKIVNPNFREAFKKGEQGVFERSKFPILRLKFSKNTFSDSHTLTLEFDLDKLGSLSIQDIINGLLTTLFECDLSGNWNIPPLIARNGQYTSNFDVNKILYSNTNFATKKYAEMIEERNEKFNKNCRPIFKKSIKKDGVFSQPCVIEIRFESKVSSDGEKITFVRFMSYTTLQEAGAGCGYKYYGWDKYARYPNGIVTLQVDKEFKPQNGFSLNEKDEFYVFPSYEINGNLTPQFIYRFDKDNITKQIDGIREELISPPSPPSIRRTAFDDEFDKREKRRLEEQRKEEERRAGLTPEQRDAEDRAAAAEREWQQQLIDYSNCGQGGC